MSNTSLTIERVLTLLAETPTRTGQVGDQACSFLPNASAHPFPVSYDEVSAPFCAKMRLTEGRKSMNSSKRRSQGWNNPDRKPC